MEDEEVGSSGKASLSEKVVLVLLAVEAGVVKEDSGFLPSRRVLGHAITECAINACAIKAGAGAGRPGLGFASYSTGRSGLGSLCALQVGLVSRSIGWQYDAGVGSGSPSFGGSSMLWRRQQVLEAAVSSGGSSKLWGRQQALETAASSSR